MTLHVPFASKAAAQQRFNVCKSCEHLSKTLKVCTVCNCFALAKVRLSYTSCPLGKWGPEKEDESIKPYNVEVEIK